MVLYVVAGAAVLGAVGFVLEFPAALTDQVEC